MTLDDRARMQSVPSRPVHKDKREFYELPSTKSIKRRAEHLKCSHYSRYTYDRTNKPVAKKEPFLTAQASVLGLHFTFLSPVLHLPSYGLSSLTTAACMLFCNFC